MDDNKPSSDASDRPDTCHCGGAGAPCPKCNQIPGRKPDLPLDTDRSSIGMAEALMANLKDMKTWRDRLGRSGLRSFTDAEGRFWLEQNPAKASKWAKLAREGHEVAWEFEKPGGGYTGRILIDGEIYSASEATKRFFPKAEVER